MKWWNRKKFRKDIEKRSMTCWKGERKRVMSCELFCDSYRQFYRMYPIASALNLFISLKICKICVRIVFLHLTKYGNRVGELHYQSYECPKGKDNHGDY